MKNKNVKKALAKTYIGLILIFMYLPIIVLTIYSFSTSKVIGGTGEFTFENFNKLFHNSDIMAALGNTILIALISAFVSTFLGTLGAIGAFYSKRKGKKAINMATQIPIANAEIVIAFSLTILFVFLGQYVFKKDLFSFWTLLIGHVSLSIPFVFINVKPKLQQMDPSLYEAALDLGASPMQALRKVILPEITPGVLSGFMLSVTLSLDDFIITSFTRGAGLLSGNNNITTISTFVQDSLKRKSVPIETRALCSVVFLAVVIGVAIISIYKKKAMTKSKKRKGRVLYAK